MGFPVILLAAGRGTRMCSDLAKVLHPLAGRPLAAWIVDAARDAGAEPVVAVVGYQADRVRGALAGRGVQFVEQRQQLGTAHAVLSARQAVSGAEHVLVLPGDAPLLEASTLQALRTLHAESGAAATLLTAEVDDPTGYGRVLRDESGRVARIREEADVTAAERRVREVNTAVACFSCRQLFPALSRVGRDNAKGEYYLVDVVPLLLSEGLPVETLRVDDATEVLGVNDRVALAAAETAVRRRLLEGWMRRGVTIVDPATTYVDADVEIGRDTVLHPFTVLRGRTRVGERCALGPGAQVSDSVLGDGCSVGTSVLEACRLEDGAGVGPFSHLRPGTVLERGAAVGNFAELKNTRVGRGSKVPHHCYLGDAAVGEDANVGAGAVTVNYDGERKHHTTIEAGAFVGCNANLIAPVRVGRRGYVAAGSTVHRDVPPEALAIGRSRQQNKDAWVRRRFGRGDDDGADDSGTERG